MDKYYDKDGIVVSRSVISDIAKMKNNLRPSDVKEVWASHHYTPCQALEACVYKAIFACTIKNGKPLGIFGINTDNIVGTRATIFMLSTPDLDKIERRFVRNSRAFIRLMLSYYPYLDNWVHADNKQSIKWLRWLGAVIEEPKPYGIEGEMFHHFYFEEKQ